MIFLMNVLHQLYHLQLQVAPESKKRLVMEESLMLGFQPMKKTNFNVFPMACVSPQIKKEDLDFILDEIERLEKDL